MIIKTHFKALENPMQSILKLDLPSIHSFSLLAGQLGLVCEEVRCVSSLALYWLSLSFDLPDSRQETRALKKRDKNLCCRDCYSWSVCSVGQMLKCRSLRGHSWVFKVLALPNAPGPVLVTTLQPSLFLQRSSYPSNRVPSREQALARNWKGRQPFSKAVPFTRLE